MSRSRAAAARGSMARYIHAASGHDEELARLRLLQERYDARTFGRLTALGSLAGAVCLGVGAGAGSVARWLAQAGSSGRVVATDADPRFLACVASSASRCVATTSWRTRLNRPGTTWSTAVPCSAISPIRPEPSASWRPPSGQADGCWSRTPTTARSWPPTRPIPAHRVSTRLMRTLLAFIAAGRAFDPFFGRRLGPTLPLGKLTSRLYRSSTRPGPRIKPQADAPAGRWFLP